MAGKLGSERAFYQDSRLRPPLLHSPGLPHFAGCHPASPETRAEPTAEWFPRG